MKPRLLNALTLISLIILLISLSTWIISSPAYSIFRCESQFILTIPLNEATRTQIRDQTRYRDPDATKRGLQTWFGQDKPIFRFAGISLHRFQTTTVDEAYLAIPYWSLAVLSSILPLIWLIRSRVHRRSKSTPRCPTCGYDVRATPDRCPECGTTLHEVAAVR